MSNQKILQRGAEALIILKDNKLIIKRRVAKSYRLSELDDRLRRQRTRSEVKLLEKASKIISVPQIENVDENKKEISMDFIKGKKLSKHLNKFPLNKQKDICLAIGQNIAKLHNVDIIHGDLTTSNMIYIEEKTKDNKKILGDKKLSKISNYPNSSINKNVFGRVGGEKINSPGVYFIDFGLGFISQKIEDKAVDLHLLKQALEAKHFKNWETLFGEVLKDYSISKESKKVLEQLKKVEKRGRYKEQY